MMKEASVTKFMQSRAAGLIAAALVVAGGWWAYTCGGMERLDGFRGIVLASPNLWIAKPEVSLWVNLGLNLLAACCMAALTNVSNLMRSSSILYAGLFLVMQLGMPELLGQFYGGTVMVLAAVVCSTMLFSCYDGAGGNRRIFMIFLLLSAGTLCLYPLAVMIPVFLLGMAQMKAINGRSLTAAALGLITPAWILWGGGLVDGSDIHWPDFHSIFKGTDSAGAAQLITAAAVTVFTAVATWVMSLTKMIAYNARTRSMNGFLSLMTLAMIVMMAVDHDYMLAYVPTLNFCAAYQAAHYVSTRRHERGYVTVLSIISVYTLLYIWQTIG